MELKQTKMSNVVERVGFENGSKSWVCSKVSDPLLQILDRGVEPKQLAFSAALGITLGVFPVCGMTVLLCGLVIAMFGSVCHAPTVMMTNFIATPIELSLMIPFLRLGEFVTGGPHFQLTSDALRNVLTGQASLEVLQSIYKASTVKYLPGFEGPLPFELETGYVGVDDSEVQLFYYFVKSEKNPEEDPLLLWIDGGPGCSSFYGFIFENGPLKFGVGLYNGSLPTLVLNPNSWTKTANILFLDSPVFTGFSYATNPRASPPTDVQTCHHAYQFLQKWLIGHSEFISNPFYVGGDSYAGIPVPIITQIISDGNEVHTNQHINLQGYVLGNPVTYFHEENNYRIPFAHGMGIISDELYESLVKSCRGEYRNISPNNVECFTNMEAYKKCLSKINEHNILEPFEYPVIYPNHSVPRERALSENNIKFHDDNYHPSISFTRVDRDGLSYFYMNDKSVQNALHIRNRTAKDWVRCNTSLPYTKTINDSRPYHVHLSKKGYRSLIYSGDQDLTVTYKSTQAWIRELKYSIVDDWRSWIVDEQVAGYTRTYSNKMTFATVRGGGHTAPEWRPVECCIMFKRWISGEPL